MNVQKSAVRLFIGMVVLGVFLPGCIFVRTTDHRIHLNNDGSGQALLRLIDIRSDQVVDSLVRKDFDEMMLAYTKPGIDEFEQTGRKVTSKQFSVHGDTLILEIAYTFQRLEAVEGLRLTADGIYVAVGEGREIVRTDGKVESWKGGTKRIVWDTDENRIQYVVRETNVPPTVSLASLYRKWLGR
jgi:hypothetical protein